MNELLNSKPSRSYGAVQLRNGNNTDGPWPYSASRRPVGRLGRSSGSRRSKIEQARGTRIMLFTDTVHLPAGHSFTSPDRASIRLRGWEGRWRRRQRSRLRLVRWRCTVRCFDDGEIEGSQSRAELGVLVPLVSLNPLIPLIETSPVVNSPLRVEATLSSGVVFDRGSAPSRAESVDGIGRVAQLRRLRTNCWVGGRVRVLLGA